MKLQYIPRDTLNLIYCSCEGNPKFHFSKAKEHQYYVCDFCQGVKSDSCKQCNMKIPFHKTFEVEYCNLCTQCLEKKRTEAKFSFISNYVLNYKGNIPIEYRGNHGFLLVDETQFRCQCCKAKTNDSLFAQYDFELEYENKQFDFYDFTNHWICYKCIIDIGYCGKKTLIILFILNGYQKKY